MIIGLNVNMKNKRREFLKNVCPSVALAFFGVTMLEACSSGGDDNQFPPEAVVGAEIIMTKVTLLVEIQLL